MATVLREAAGQIQRREVRGFLLLAPAFMLMVICFVLPVGQLLYQSVDNSDVLTSLPRTVKAIKSWNGAGLPDDAAFAALIDDLRNPRDPRLLSKVANRFNFERPGFRSILLSTARKLKAGDVSSARQALLEANTAWEDPRYWHIIRRAAHPLSTFNLLAAVDLRWTDDDRLAPFSQAGSLHLLLLGRMLVVSAGVTLLCLLVGYPFAYLMTSASRTVAAILLTVILFPFWTSLLVRTTAWMVLLQNEGVVNNLALKLGLWSERIQLIHNRFGVYVVMVHVLLPYMVFPLYSVMRNIPADYLRAAGSLGATGSHAFRRVYLPLTMPGVIAGSIIVFILALGYYITPALVGGPSDQMISYFISYYTTQSLNWGMAAALSLVLMLVIAAIAAALWLLVRSRWAFTA